MTSVPLRTALEDAWDSRQIASPVRRTRWHIKTVAKGTVTLIGEAGTMPHEERLKLWGRACIGPRLVP